MTCLTLKINGFSGTCWLLVFTMSYAFFLSQEEMFSAARGNCGSCGSSIWEFCFGKDLRISCTK